jgi:HAD superfamily hydrolase (TIGR01509 family)
MTEAGRLTGVSTLSFDFGNTLVPVGRAALEAVVERMTLVVVERCGPIEPAAFRRAWAEERDRQFAEDVPELHEVDLDRRLVRVLARLRGMPLPRPRKRWDDLAAAAWSSPAEVDLGLAAYSEAFLDVIPPPPEVGPLLSRLARRYRLAILSNWPLASTVEAYVRAAGWQPDLAAVVVSQRVGTIKPDPRIFRAAEAALGEVPTRILHVGDDWAADVVGAIGAGWRAAYLRDRQAGSPLPGSEPDGSVVADLVIDDLAELEAALSRPGVGPAGASLGTPAAP